MSTEKQIIDTVKCCRTQSSFAAKCCTRSISWTIYILMYIVPIVVQSCTLAYYSNDFNTVMILLISYSCFIMATTMYAGIRLVMDCRHSKIYKGQYSNKKTYDKKECTCEYAYCTPLWKPKSLLMGTHWLHILFLWEICNIASVGYFGDQLVKNNLNIIIGMAFFPFLIFPIASGIGYAISRWIDSYKKNKVEQCSV